MSSNFNNKKRRPSLLGGGGARHRGNGGRSSSSFPIRGIPGYLWMPTIGLVGTVTYAYYAFLEEVPLTKRKRWIATSVEMEQRLGDEEYRKLLRQFRGRILPRTHVAAMTVQRVGSRIADASRTFATQHGGTAASATGSSSSQYTYTVVRSNQANAFVLPNNHVFVLTGLFQFVKNEDDLAAVLGHEMAHNLARHAGEQLSGNVVLNVLARLVFLVDPSGILSFLLLPAANVLHTLPNSREAEMEADQIGVTLAALACYDPRAAKRVFAAMKEHDGTTPSATPPEFLSTHPSHDTRLDNFDQEQWMKDAINLYESDGGYRCRHVREEMAQARHRAAQRQRQRTTASEQRERFV